MKKFLNALLVLCLSFGLYAYGDDGEGEGAAGGSAGGAGEGGAGGGGEDVALMCGDPACGGDLTGSWNLTEACTTPDAAEGFAAGTGWSFFCASEQFLCSTFWSFSCA